MELMQRIAFGICVWLAAATSTGVFAQADMVGGPLTGPPVTDAPFSADATTTIRQTLRDGTRVERIGIARYYRDRLGRVRVEHIISGLDPLNSAAKGQVRITIQSDPAKRMVYALDSATRTANALPRFMGDLSVGGGATYALPLGGPRWQSLIFSRGERLRRVLVGSAVKEVSLGSRQIAGVETIGRRHTIAVPASSFDRGRPFEIVDERWESPELKMLIYALSSDPRTGFIEYRLTNIHRNQPPDGLFVIPSDYAIATTGDNGWAGVVYAERNGQASQRW